MFKNNNLRSLCSLFKYQVVEIKFNKFSHIDIELEPGMIVVYDNNNYCPFDNIIGGSDQNVDTVYSAIAIKLNKYESEFDDYMWETAVVVDILSVDRHEYEAKMRAHLNQGFKSSQLFDEFIEDVEIDEIEETDDDINIDVDDIDIEKLEGGVI